ncbi:MAG TPA: VCBS repeat-containing protein [Phycisphaerae bacterium]|nr:VCBS repeat-containing protein [Phycisphaerae bacterium]
MIFHPRWIVVTALALSTLFAGCSSPGAGTGNTGNTSGGNDGSPTPSNDAAGFFVDGSNNVEGEGPRQPSSDEEDGEETQSHFRGIQVDPRFEDTAGAKFVTHADINGDGMVDIITGHNQSQPVQLHIQGRDQDGNVVFDTVTIGGTLPIGTMAGVEVADMDQDGALDVVVLVKSDGTIAFCLDGEPNSDNFTGLIAILFSPGPAGDITDGDQWQQVIIQDSYSPFNNRWGKPQDQLRAIDFPEEGGYTSLAVGEIDGVNGPDIVVTSNVPIIPCGTGLNTVELWLNPGNNARNGDSQMINSNAVPALNMPPTFWYPIWLDINAPLIRDCGIYDVDGDGDLDVVAAHSNTATQNIRWYRNPLNEQGLNAFLAGSFQNDNKALFTSTWEQRPIGTVDGDVGNLVIGDMDNDGFDDVLVRAFGQGVAMWFRRPTLDTDVDPTFPPDNPDNTAGDNTPVPDRFNFPWQVYVLDDFSPFRPVGLAIGDLTNDGANDAVVSVGGALYWFDSTVGISVFDEWGRDFVLDDTKENGTTDDPTDIDFVDNGTLINNMIVVDVDGDGVNDIVATFDRRVDSGLADDSVVWFRNTLFEENN